MVKRRLSILGSTGSIGCSTIDVIAHLDGAETYDIVALTAGSNAKKLAEQALALKPAIAVVADEGALPELKSLLSGSGIEVAAGDNALIEAAGRSAEWTMSAIAGAAGLRPTLEAIRSGAALALANKESMVCAGPLVKAEAAKANSPILPVDSEHNAIFQVFNTAQRDAIERIILTASGGPFRSFTLQEMQSVTPAQALAHPNWSMGDGISLDSATMFNKGLELIEAAHLFDVPSKQIEIVVHPQSVIHSMVGYSDGSVLAQMGDPDMRTPIANALGWPDRVQTSVERLDFRKFSRLDFEAPDETRFPALRIARDALEAGGLLPCAMNAAKEVAATAFIGNRIGFLDLAAIVDQVLSRIDLRGTAQNLNDILAADCEARRVAAEEIASGRFDAT
jgi:1-deoxy-D-xylulose-5-phosphate reductoisomerase